MRTNQYSYTLTHTGENTAESAAEAIDEANPTLPEGAELLPRYTDDGRLYEYRAIEVVWGLLDQPGGFTPEWIQSGGENGGPADFSAIRDSEEDSMGIYVIEHGETGSFLISNIYSSPTGNLTVQKHYTGREAGDRYPDTTFDVYRYYVRADGSQSDAALVDSVTLTNDMLKAGAEQTQGLKVTGAGEAATTAQYTFSGLDIYAPDGSYWQYYVVEHTINGYTTTVGVGNLDADTVTGNGEAVDGGVSSGVLCPEEGTADAPEPGDGSAGDGQATREVTGTVLAEMNGDQVEMGEDGQAVTDTDPDVTFKNNYATEDTDLPGTKTWSDFNNIFHLRPTVEEFTAGLTVTQIDNGAETDITDSLQSTHENNPYYFTVTTSEGSNNYTITLNNVPLYAPDGTAYQYRITEKLSGMVLGETGDTGEPDAGSQETADHYYTASNDSSTVTAGSGGQFSFTNSLKGQASVTKVWNDGGDPYGLRPTSVTVRLQARYTYANGDTGAWRDPVEILNVLGYWTTFASQFETEDAARAFFQKTLNADNGWRASWTDLPTAGRGAAAGYEGVLFTIDYRVVEVAIGDQKIDQPSDVGTGENCSFQYTSNEGGYHPYQPAQDSWTNENGHSDTTISNTLEGTSISATKSWDDAKNAWGTRPGGNNWSVTYLLQRKLGADGDWTWVVGYGDPEATTPLDSNIVRETITASDENGTATWDNLPMYHTNGTAYEYRVVEQVPGSYDVEGGTEVATATANGVTYRYYVVDSTEGTGDAPDSQTFTNDLRTTTLTGTKKWDDHGTGLASGLTEDDMPTMTLYRAIVTGRDAEGNPTSFGGAEPVTYHGSDDGQPTWTVSGDTWTFTYEGLPAANEDDVEYVYWAEEQLGSAEGYYPLYGSTDNQTSSSQDASGTTITNEATAADDGAQQNEQITNVATRFTLDKVSDFTPADQDEPENLRNIELTVYGADSEVYAVWRDADGTASSFVWPEGIAESNVDSAIVNEEALATSGGYSPTGADAGYIIGLPAGTYTVEETGTVPKGYAKAPTVTITIANNGQISARQSGNESVLEVADGNPGGTITVNVEDPVLRAHLSFTKYVSDDGAVDGGNRAPLAGAVFSLYQVNEGGGADVLVASGLTSDENGVVATNSSTNSAISLTQAFVEAHGGKYTTLASGLPEGTYYFVETDATTGAVMPTGDATKSPELKITQTDHGTIVSTIAGSDDPAQMGNEDFSATVKLHKYDTQTGGPVENAVFNIAYTPEEGSSSTQSRSWTETTDGNGILTIDGPSNSGLEKGSYVVTEASNKGYVASDFEAAFAIAEDDDDQTYDITTTDSTDDAVEAIGFTVNTGTYTADDGDPNTTDYGIPNTPERGSVTMTKRGANSAALNGATFELRRLGDDGTTWETIAEGLVTGQAYAMNDENSALNGTGEAGTTGRITVTNLLWGTYKFVETTPAPGYIGVDDEGTALESNEVTVNRTNGLNAAALAGTVTNAPTSLELNKQNDAGQPLEGAAFQIAAQGDSVFASPDAFAAGTYDEATKTVTLPTDSTGHIELIGQLVVGGTYTVYESAAPSGYDPADGVLTIEVQSDGSLEAQGELPDRYAWADLDEDGSADNAYSFMVTNIHEEIELRKVSADNPDVPVEGAVFTLTGMCMDNNSTHTYTTNEDGVIQIDDGLMGGVRYALTETTPGAGYVARPDTLYFMMDTRGEIQVTDAQGNPLDQANWPAGYTVDEDGISLTVTDESVDLQIAKIDPDGNPLPGAVFRVTPAPGTNTTFADGSAEVQDLRTGEDGTCYWGAKLVVGGTYDITEVSAPEGYERVEGIMRVQVADDGTINVLGSVDGEGNLIGQLPPIGYERTDSDGDGVADNAFEVQVTNEPVEIWIIKVDGDDHARYLPGATFEVTGAFAGSNEEETRRYTVDATGELMGTKNISAELKSGETYKLTEAAAPAGYELIKGTLSFKVNENGTVEAVGDVPAGYSIEQGNVTIVAADEPIEVSFAKKDLGDTSLAGARFTLSGTFVNDATHETSQQSIPFDTTNEAFTFDALSYEGATYSLVAGQTYTLTEDAAPAGYEKLPAFSFTVAYDGTITVANDSTEATDGTPGYVIDEQGGTVTLTAHDRPIEVRLQKRGTDTGDALLDGAVFSLLNAETGEVLDDDVRPTADGAVGFAGLVGGGTYVLRETKAPAGYELVGDVTFSVATDGTVTIAGGAAGWTAENADSGVATLTATDEPVEARLVKTDADGTPLAGAGFEIVPAAGSSFAGEPELTEDGALEVGPTGDDGVAAIPTGVLIAGDTYTVSEITSPDGYELAGTVTFTVGADGTIALDGAAVGAPVAGASGSGTYVASAEDGTAVITATDQLTELTVLKATADPNAPDGKTYLAGAEFTLTEVMNRGTEAGETTDGSAREPQVLTGTTAEDGSVSFTGLKVNTSYVLEETEAPAGYERLADTATLVVAPDGTATIADGNASGAFAVASDGVTIEVVDHKLGVSLVKTDLAGTALAGGTFKLAPADEDATFLDGTAEKKFTSDEFGTVFTDLQLEGSAEGTAYVLTETEAPAGFERIDPVTFLVFEDGRVALADTATDAQGEQVAIVNDAEDGIAVITVRDTPIELSLKKIDPDGKTLAGAEFKINGRFADGSTQATLTVDADGVIELPAPIAGETYTLSETAAPDGYERIMGTWSFRVTSDGSIDATDSSVVAIFGGQRSMGYAVADDGITILAVDVPTPPSDRLTSTGDSSLTLVCVCAAFGLMALAGGLRLRRKRR